jgi:cytoskeletal protein CcmA (bactofilin family)
MLRWLQELLGQAPDPQNLQGWAGRKKEPPLSALMGAGSSYEGDLSFEGRVRVDGHFTGRIYTEDCLEVGVGGVVSGECDVARAVVSGRIEGKVRVREHLLVEAGGVVSGVVDVGVIEVVAGGRIEGEVKVLGVEMG